MPAWTPLTNCSAQSRHLPRPGYDFECDSPVQRAGNELLITCCSPLIISSAADVGVSRTRLRRLDSSSARLGTPGVRTQCERNVDICRNVKRLARRMIGLSHVTSHVTAPNDIRVTIKTHNMDTTVAILCRITKAHREKNRALSHSGDASTRDLTVSRLHGGRSSSSLRRRHPSELCTPTPII